MGIEFSDAIYSFVNFFRGYADFVDNDGYLNYKILVLWGLVAFFAVYAVMDIRSARGMLTGFLVSIVGAVFLMMLLTVTTNEMKNELVKLDAIASEGKAAPAAVTYPDAEHAKSHENEIRRKKVALSKSIDLSGILMNFIIMTLGGFGSGVLAAVAVSSSTVFKPYNYKRRAAVLDGFLYFFSYLMLCSLPLGLICLGFVVFSEFAFAYGYLKPAVGFVVAFILSFLGYVVAFSSKSKWFVIMPSLLLASIAVTVFYTSFCEVLRSWGLVSFLAFLPVVLYEKCRALIRTFFLRRFCSWRWAVASNASGEGGETITLSVTITRRA
ncbi:hypothetical protein [Pseudomonas fluorescens]|uniref:hypothetical protein n=1 Tax=Pseudomonas fluorescens TaxID=294 RepID=UPI000F465B9D|nr:hypothetical protein [Pseudomonas fluorescens]RON82858.1 hypothetical protein BK668_25575 [Pseudomonas fluorescens]